MEIKLNIGLNTQEGKPLNKVDVISEILKLKHIYVVEAKEVIGTYKEEIEPTLFVNISYRTKSLSQLISEIESLTIALKQDCIAVVTPMGSFMTFNPDYNGERFRFDPSLFKE